MIRHRRRVPRLPPDLLQGKSYQANLRGRFTYFQQVYEQGFRIEDASKFKYELYVGLNAPPDFTASGQPVATSATLPFVWSPTSFLPSSGTGDLHCVVRLRNTYNLESFNIYDGQSILRFIGHVHHLGPLTAPKNVVVYDKDPGFIQPTATYQSSDDVDPADTWEVYVKIGSDPVPGVDTPAYSGAMVFIGPTTVVQQAVGPYAAGATAHVIVCVVRSADNGRACAPVVLHTLPNSLDLVDGFLFGGTTFEER